MDPPQEFKPIRYFRKLTLTYDILLSSEFRSLSKASRDVYIIFLYKREIKSSKGNGKPAKVANNGRIQFTENEAIKKWKIPKNTFWRAIKELKEAKMIELVHKGFGSNHDANLYGLVGKFNGLVSW